MTDKPRARVTADGRLYFHDGLRNVVANLGTDRDKRSYNRFVFSNFHDWQQLEAAYQDSWLARQIVDAPVEDATREWRVFSCKEAAKIREEENRCRLQAVTQEAFKWGGLYGGAVILMITDQLLDRPLEIKRIKKGSLKRLLVIDRFSLSGFDYNYTDPMAENFLLPESYSIYGGSQRIHHTHLIRIPGAKLPLRLKQMNGGWDDSQLRKCLEDIKDAMAAKGGIASLILEANVDVIQRQGLSDELASNNDENLIERFRLAALLKAINGMLLLDGNEIYQRNPASFGGLGEVLSTLMEWVSGAAQIPMTRLFGVQAKGLGDSGEGDMKNYYNSIRGKQESDYREALERLDEVLIRSALGYMPDDCQFEWNPLSQPSGVELAQQDLADAQADELRLNQGVVKRSHIAVRLKEAGRYSITDEEIRKMHELEKAEANGEFDEDDSGEPDPFAAPDGNEPAGGATEETG